MTSYGVLVQNTHLKMTSYAFPDKKLKIMPYPGKFPGARRPCFYTRISIKSLLHRMFSYISSNSNECLSLQCKINFISDAFHNCFKFLMLTYIPHEQKLLYVPFSLDMSIIMRLPEGYGAVFVVDRTISVTHLYII